MKCPHCGTNITETARSYLCPTCSLTIWKTIAGKKITYDIAKELFSKGKTPVMDGFISRKGKPFSSALVLEGKRITFKFPEQIETASQETNGAINIRVESSNSGTVMLKIDNPINQNSIINYGLVPSRMAECLGMITAISLIKHHSDGHHRKRLTLSINNLDFSRYLLKEHTPRDKQMRANLKYLWQSLKPFNGWEARYQPNKKPKLKGGPQSINYPYGIFPWLNLIPTTKDEEITVRLPNTPDLVAQFTASFNHATHMGNSTYSLPLASQQALHEWINAVKG